MSGRLREWESERVEAESGKPSECKAEKVEAGIWRPIVKG